MQALKLYKLDNLRYPTTEQGLQALIQRPTLPPEAPNWKGNGYLEKLPNDPWGHPYQYQQHRQDGEVDVMNLGADGAPSGEGTTRISGLRIFERKVHHENMLARPMGW